MSNTNFASNINKKAQLSLIIVGRGGKIRTSVMRADKPGTKAVNKMYDVPAGSTLRQALMEAIAGEITKYSNAFAEKGLNVNMEVFTVGQVSIKYYQMVPMLKGGHVPTEADIDAICTERDTADDKHAYMDLAEAIAGVIAQGNGVHLQASGNADVFELIIPEGVEVEDGQLLDFTNGSTLDGIQVRGWRNANRIGAKVIVRGTKNPRAYITKAADPEKPWKGLATLLDTINGCWKDLPVVAVDKSADEGSEEDLVG